MKNLSLATTALYLALASSAFADSNSLIISQATVGAAAPSLNFTQSGSGAAASIIQNGNNTLTGVQVGTGGTKLNVDQENPTGGAINTINYTGRGNSNVTVYQRAANGLFTAPGSAGNTANIDMAGNVAAGPANSLTLDQVGFNNTATIYDAYPGVAIYPTYPDRVGVAQYSDTAAAGNQLQLTVVSAIGAGGNTSVTQVGGNKANLAVTGGGDQDISISQTNTADNIASANVANINFIGADFQWTQNGTNNTVQGNLGGNTVNGGIKGFQSGNGNIANLTQDTAYVSIYGGDILDQTGNNNIANATQSSTHDSFFNIIQNGIGNNATVVQYGTNNIANLTQTGTVNVASLVQSGTGATAIIAQH